MSVQSIFVSYFTVLCLKWENIRRKYKQNFRTAQIFPQFFTFSSLVTRNCGEFRCFDGRKSVEFGFCLILQVFFKGKKKRDSHECWGQDWGQGLGQTGDITAVFAANFTAILVGITLGDRHLNFECRDKINVELRRPVTIFLQVCLNLPYTSIEHIDIAQRLHGTGNKRNDRTTGISEGVATAFAGDDCLRLAVEPSPLNRGSGFVLCLSVIPKTVETPSRSFCGIKGCHESLPPLYNIEGSRISRPPCLAHSCQCFSSFFQVNAFRQFGFVLAKIAITLRILGQ